MKVSLNTIKQYIDFDLPTTDELVAKINEQLGGVEEIIDFADKYKDAKIIRVVECDKHPNADKLSVCKIDAGEKDLVQVVCGAPNVHADMWAIWLPPESVVPATYDDAEPFKLGARELRGVMSNGMLAAGDELDLNDDHDGIVELTDADMPKGKSLKTGVSFAETFGMNDTVIDIENKMFTHRPDCFGQLGVAREIAGILGHTFTSPADYIEDPEFEKVEGLTLEVENDAPDKVQRFMAIAVKDVEVKPSPMWLQCELVRLGGKPINNVVDVTNYIMFHTAQPVHAYDYDKVSTGKLGVRMAKKGETIALLNGKVEELNDTDIVITDGKKPIGLGGVMGGSETEVSSETKNLILECATFDMYTIRRTSMHHGLFTDAVTRFTKGQSPLQNDRVLHRLQEMVVTLAGGKIASSVVDDKNLQTFSEQSVHAPLEIPPDFINKRLGLELTKAEIEKLLGNVEFTFDVNYVAPFWRTDIEIPEDVVEEVGRLYGFDKLPQDLPRRNVSPAIVAPIIGLKRQLRDILSRAGANEVLTYSFVHENILNKAGQSTDDTYGLSNALSPDLQYLRRSLLPSLLDKIHPNVKTGYGEFAIYEIGKGHKISAGVDDEGVPVEQQFVSLVLAGGDFYRAKKFVEFMGEQLGVRFEYKPLSQGKLFEPKRGALIFVGDKVVGAVGEFRSVIRKGFKLPDLSAGFEIDLDTLLSAIGETRKLYKPLSKYPSTDRDVTFKVSVGTSYAEIESTVEENLQKTSLDIAVKASSIYQPENSDTKNVTLSITLTPYEKTLTGDEVADIVENMTKAVCDKLKAEVV